MPDTSPLSESLLAGLAQESAAPDAADARRLDQALLIEPDDLLIPADEGDIFESAEAGFTGEITDKIGRKVRFVNGKRVPRGVDPKSGPDSFVHARYNGEDVHLVAHDSEHGLVKVRTSKGEETIKVGELDLGKDAKTFGKSGAEVQVRIDEEEVDRRLTTDIFPGKTAEEARQLVADCVGAPDDAQVFLFPDEYSDKLIVSIKHKDIARCDRTIGVDENGQRFIHNDYLKMKTPGSGLGTQVFARQVENAAENGFSYIATTAGGSYESVGPDGKFIEDKLSGYWFWPQVGYDAPLVPVLKNYGHLRYEIADIFHDINTELSLDDDFDLQSKTIRDVILMPGGLQWWKEHGEEISGMTFDLSDGSESREMLELYLERKEKRKGKS